MDPTTAIKLKKEKGKRPGKRRKPRFSWLEHGLFLIFVFIAISAIGSGTFSLQKDILAKFEMIDDGVYGTAWNIADISEHCNFIKNKSSVSPDDTTIQNLYSEIGKNTQQILEGYHSLGMLISKNTYLTAVFKLSCLTKAILSTNPNEICNSSVLPSPDKMQSLRDDALAGLDKDRDRYKGLINPFIVYIQSFFSDKREKEYKAPFCDQNEMVNSSKT